MRKVPKITRGMSFRLRLGTSAMESGMEKEILKLMTVASLCHGCDWASCPRKSVPDATLLKDWSSEYVSTRERDTVDPLDRSPV